MIQYWLRNMKESFVNKIIVDKGNDCLGYTDTCTRNLPQWFKPYSGSNITLKSFDCPAVA